MGIIFFSLMIKKQSKEVWKSTHFCETVSTGHFSEKLTRKLRRLGGMSIVVALVAVLGHVICADLLQAVSTYS